MQEMLEKKNLTKHQFAIHFSKPYSTKPLTTEHEPETGPTVANRMQYERQIPKHIQWYECLAK